MKKSTLLINNVRLRPGQIHKFRGFVGNLFKEHDLIHNHDLSTGKAIYRYPLIQFKLVDNTPAIISITDRAVEVFGDIFMKLDKIVIDGFEIPVFEKDLKIEDVEFGFAGETFMYEFVSPWIGLNQKNFKTFITLRTEIKRSELLKRILIGNILSTAKYLGCHLSPDQRIETQLNIKSSRATLKGKSMIGFKGVFKTNFMLPDHIGLGKSVSRGFGTIQKIL